MTYIEREALLEKLNEYKNYLRDIYGEINELDKECCRGELAGAASAVGMVEAAPAADVAPVKRGRWEFKHNPIDDPKGYFIRIVCSECNLHTGQKSKFCPNCGADMRED